MGFVHVFSALHLACFQKLQNLAVSFERRVGHPAVRPYLDQHVGKQLNDGTERIDKDRVLGHLCKLNVEIEILIDLFVFFSLPVQTLGLIKRFPQPVKILFGDPLYEGKGDCFFFTKEEI